MLARNIDKDYFNIYLNVDQDKGNTSLPTFYVVDIFEKSNINRLLSLLL